MARTLAPRGGDRRFLAAGLTAGNVNSAHTNVLVQVYNEPETYSGFAEVVRWCAAVYDENLKLKSPLRFCFLNVAVGHIAEYAAPLLDPLLRKLAGYTQGSVIGFHEYAEHSTKLERPHHIGRFELIANRCRQLGLPPVQMVVTEYGRDNGGGYEDGYRSHMTSEQYVQFLWEGMDAYAPFNIPVNVFCYGDGYNRWDKFNIEGDTVVNEGIERYGKVAPAQALFRGRPVMPALAEGKVLSMPGDYVNVRLYPTLPTASVLGQIKRGADVQFRAFGRDWYYVHGPDSVRGYVSTQDGKVRIG